MAKLSQARNCSEVDCKMRDDHHNTGFMVTVAAIGAGMMALYPLSHATGILGLIIFLGVVLIELLF